MRAVGGDEVHHRNRVLEVGGELGPARIGRQERRAARGVELLARLVERRHAGVAAARDVDRRKVERQAEQAVAQRVDDELVDLVAALDRHAAHDGGRALVVGEGAVIVEADRIEERLDQTEFISGNRLTVRANCIDRVTVLVDARHVLRQHGVAEAVHHVGELAEDGRIDIRDVVEHEHVDHRLNLACELLEDEMLVLHLGREAGRLEQALAVPA